MLKNMLVRKNSKYKGLNMRECLMFSRKKKELIIGWSQMNKEECDKRWGWRDGPRSQIMGDLVDHGKNFRFYSMC